MIRVVIADDEQKVSLLIRNLVDWDSIGMEVVGVADNGLEAMEFLRYLSPEILLTDIRMSGIDGLELIKRAKELNPQIEIIIISGYGYFDYAQVALRYGVRDYILKPINKGQITETLVSLRDKILSESRQLSETQQISANLKGVIEKLRVSLIDEIIVSGAAELKSEPLRGINERYCYSMRPGLFRICALKIDGDCTAMPPESLAVLMDKCCAAIRDDLSPNCHDMEAKRDGGFAYFLLNYAPEDGDAVIRGIRGARNKLRDLAYAFKSAEFTVATGAAVPEFGMIGSSFCSARFAIMQRLFEGCGIVIEGKPGAEAGFFDDSRILAETLTALESSLEREDRDGVSRALSGFAGKLPGLPGVSGESLIATCLGLFDGFVSLLRKLNYGASEGWASPREFAAVLNMCPTAEKALEYVKQAIETSADAALKRKSEEDAMPIRAAKQFIQANYMNQITLDEVSGIAGFSPSYFSYLFKKETGGNYLEYLSDLRIKKAKDLLRGTRRGVADICAAVGYSDIKHFTKTFKKITGISPREYRKLYS